MREDSAFAINHALRSKGLASLSDGPALVAQLAMFVRGHNHFRQLLIACEPQERGHMYDALAPNVRFKAKPLADYMIEAARDAEVRQLPTIGEDGQFKPFKVAEIEDRRQKTEDSKPSSSDAAVVQRLVSQAVEKEHLHVVCAKCTKEDVFGGVTRQDAVDALRGAGWKRGVRWYRDTAEPTEICPECAV